MQLRQLREGVVVLRASNDTIADLYGTTITVEALMRDWLAGYWQHRTISQQHGRELRGLPGQHQVGVALRVDFQPQLEVELRVDDPKTRQLIAEGKLTGGSLEFLPLESRKQVVNGQESEVYYRLSPEPEWCGLSLVDIPGVPGSDVLAVRSAAGHWQFAVVDPAAITNPAAMDLRWFDHHDPVTHMVDEQKLRTALEQLERGDFPMPTGATLSREEVVRRAKEHLNRHTALGIGMRAKPAMEEPMNEWIKVRAAQLELEGLTKEQAQAKAKEEFAALKPEVRAKIEKLPANEAAQALEAAGVVINLNGLGAAPEQRAAAPEEKKPEVKPEAKPATTRRERWLQARSAQLEAEGRSAAEALQAAQTELKGNAELLATLEEREPTVEERAAAAAVAALNETMRRLPESPLAALANGGGRPARRAAPEELMGEIMVRTVIPQINAFNGIGDGITADMRLEVDNLLRRNGIDTRALTVTNQATVIRNELAAFFTAKPVNEAIGRNHWGGLPMGSAKKVEFPTFDQNSLTFEYNDEDGGSITDSDPTNAKFPIEVTDIKGAVTVGDSFLDFNAAGVQYSNQYLIPGLRSSLQLAEDLQFFLGNWSSGRAAPSTYKGLRYATGVTAVAPSTNGDAFTLKLLASLLRALPARYLGAKNRLAFYLPPHLGWDFGEIIADRKTALGDKYLEQFYAMPGPTPIGQIDGVPVYIKDGLPATETQGSSSVASTIYLVHRDALAVNSDPMIKLEPYRKEGFRTRLQIMSYTGLGYRFSEAIVRRAGVLAAV